jgi:hypothetical protein
VVTILECWVREHDVTDTAIAVKVRDCWRCIVICGNVVLCDEPAEKVSAFATHLYSRLVLADTGEFYGRQPRRIIKSPQERINAMLAAIEQNIALMGNPVLKGRCSHRRSTNG